MAETKRLTVPAAEEILGGYFPVLDHGFVSLVDYMGSDESIEHAARVSYGYGTRKLSMTRGLVRYLRRHRHTTPSEMVELKFHCAMPMFVARQWIRHRTACLAEGTEIYFDLPGGIERRGNQLYKITIEDLWARSQPTRNRTRSDKQRNPFHKRNVVQRMSLRQLNEDSSAIQHTRIVDVYKNGLKPVFRVTLADGKTIEATRDHRFLFADGWQTLAEATGLKEKSGKAIWTRGDHYLHVNGTEVAAPALYRDREWLDQQYNLKQFTADQIADICNCSVHTIRKWIKVHDIATRNGRGQFGEGRTLWNKGKGGVSSDRESIGRWTTQVAAKIHRKYSWTCQLCHLRAYELHCHHIVPVWADPALARIEDNLTTLCAACHREIAGDELAYVERLGGPPVKTEWKKRPRVPWNRLTRSRLVRIVGFEYVGEKETYDLEVEGPHHNFIANGIVTHNSVNEYSGRYSLMPLLFYTPEGKDFALQSASNRQGRADETAPELYRETIERWEATRRSAADTYRWLVDEEVARELARIDLPLSTYTQWYWKIDLHNLFHFLTLRVDPHAQWEIQQYGNVMAGMLKRVAPLSYEAWIDYEVCGTHMSRGDLEALRALTDASPDGVGPAVGVDRLSVPDLKELGLSPREARELLEKLGPAEVPDFELDLARMKPPEEFESRMREAVPGDFE